MIHFAWIIPILPLAACTVLIFFGSKLQRRYGEAVGWIGVAGIAATIPLTIGCLIDLLRGLPPASGSIAWAHLGQVTLHMSYYVDALTTVMLVMVSVVATCIMIYSVGYMHGDERYSRFFAYMCLFCFAMFTLVLSSSLLLLYVGWELVGLCSYLLIGFWFERKVAADAAKKAFITTRIGDVGFAIGILLIFQYVPSLQYSDIFAAAQHGVIPSNILAIAAVLLFCGAMGKSAQFPLHVWLPDAMAGPSPVSALIHAATMVAAGVFMVARLFPIFFIAGSRSLLFGLSPLLIVGFIGLITAVMAATLAVVQTDIKKVLAYSTISQLGYMMSTLGLGVVGFTAAVFHLITHAFFKSLLFLGAGSVMHGCDGETNMFKMGGLARKMPYTYVTFWAGALSLAGIPLLAGFFSKDEMLAATWTRAGGDASYWIFFLGLEAAAFLTAFYMGRACFLTFSRQPRSRVAEHAHESPPVMTVPLMILAFFAVFLGWVGSPWLAGNLFHHLVHFTPPAHGVAASAGAAHFNWTVAAISILMALSGLLGAACIYRWRIVSVDWVKKPFYPLYIAAKQKFYFDTIYGIFVVGGTLALAHIARLVDTYIIDGLVRGVGWAVRDVIAPASRLVDVYVVDGLVNYIGWGVYFVVATASKLFDIVVVDGLVNAGAWFTGQVGELVSRLQTGRVQEYVTGAAIFAAMFAGALVIAAYLFG